MLPRLEASGWKDLDDLLHSGEGWPAGLPVAAFATLPAGRGWQPAVNVYRCPHEYVVCVELAGIDAHALRVRAEPRRLHLRGRRPPPEFDGTQPLQVLAMEIDFGPFEREIVFALEVDLAAVKAWRQDGLIWVRLPLLAHA